MKITSFLLWHLSEENEFSIAIGIARLTQKFQLLIFLMLLCYLTFILTYNSCVNIKFKSKHIFAFLVIVFIFLLAFSHIYFYFSYKEIGWNYDFIGLELHASEILALLILLLANIRIIEKGKGLQKDRFAKKDFAKNKIAPLCYLLGFITGILFLIINPYKKDSFVKFHALQSIIFSCSVPIIQIIFFGFLYYLTIDKFFLKTIITIALIIFNQMALYLWLLSIYKSYNYEKFKLPLIGYISERLISYF